MADGLEADKILDLLESRIKRIEERVYAANGSKNLDDGKVAEAIFEAQRQLKDVEAKSAAGSTVFKHLMSLENYLSAEFLEGITSNSDSKAEIVLASENNIRGTAKLLEEIEKRKAVINEKKLLDVPQWNAKLEPLAQVQIQQMDEADETSSHVVNLLSAYNNTQFIQWDNVITQCEIAVEKAKTASQE
eukprot:gene10987-19826_t